MRECEKSVSRIPRLDYPRKNVNSTLGRILQPLDTQTGGPFLWYRLTFESVSPVHGEWRAGRLVYLASGLTVRVHTKRGRIFAVIFDRRAPRIRTMLSDEKHWKSNNYSIRRR